MKTLGIGPRQDWSQIKTRVNESRIAIILMSKTHTDTDIYPMVLNVPDHGAPFSTQAVPRYNHHTDRIFIIKKKENHQKISLHLLPRKNKNSPFRLEIFIPGEAPASSLRTTVTDRQIYRISNCQVWFLFFMARHEQVLSFFLRF